MIHKEDKYVQPVGGRIPIVMAYDEDEPDVDYLALAPVGMSLADARSEFEKAFIHASRDKDVAWMDELEALGFTFHNVAMWYEHQDGDEKVPDELDDEFDEFDGDDDDDSE